MEEALGAWNPWWASGTVPAALSGRPRLLAAQLETALPLPHVLVVSGIRRSGKSTLLYQLIDTLLRSGVPPTDLVFINLEDPAFDDRDLETLLTATPPRTGPRRYIFLDEVQAKPGWERSILPYYERKDPVKFVVTGSSADLARNEHAGLLTGRLLEWTLRPLGFAEHLRFHHPASTPTGHTERARLLADHYLPYGGFPEAQTVPPATRRLLLQQYFEQILARDMARQGSLDLTVARRLGICLAETFARPHTRRSLARAVGIGSHDTLLRYLDALRRVFLIEVATRAETSPKPDVEARAPFKVYWADVGLRNALVGNPSTDRGRQAENVVATTLAAHHPRLHYGNAGGNAEIDFIVRRSDGTVDAYQVWYDTEDTGDIAAIPPRETRAFDHLRTVLPKKRQGREILLTAKAAGETDGIQILPLHEWLLVADP